MGYYVLVLGSRDYNEMNTNGDGDVGDAVVGDGDDAQSSLDPGSGEDRCPSAISPSRSLLEVRFLRVLVSRNVGSLICLHWVEVFDKEMCLTHGTTGPYGRSVAIPVVAKASIA
jgi:hypothetical protein